MGRKPLEEASLFSRLFFSWVSPLINYGYRKRLSLEALGELSSSDQSKEHYNRFQRSFDLKRPTGGLFIAKAILHSYWNEFMLALLLNLICSGLQMTGPFLIQEIINMIQYGEEDEMWKCYVFAVIFVVA